MYLFCSLLHLLWPFGISCSQHVVGYLLSPPDYSIAKLWPLHLRPWACRKPSHPLWWRMTSCTVPYGRKTPAFPMLDPEGRCPILHISAIWYSFCNSDEFLVSPGFCVNWVGTYTALAVGRKARPFSPLFSHSYLLFTGKVIHVVMVRRFHGWFCPSEAGSHPGQQLMLSSPHHWFTA